MSKATRDTSLKSKSPAQFFADNKNIAGFDNPGKSLYTTVRELVENSLDSAESIGVLPTIDITIEEISQRNFEKLIGQEHHERRDEALYSDFHAGVAQQKKQEIEAKKAAAKKSKPGAKPEGEDAVGGGKADLPRRTSSAASGGIYRVTVKDNGQGMLHGDIPEMLGRVLSGTKYGVKQTRGKFGLGAKMTLIWAKMSTGLPITIKSARVKQSFISDYVLDIDIERNEPKVHKAEKPPNPTKWNGAELIVTIQGNWRQYGSRIRNYLRQLAVITPYAELSFRYLGPEEASKKLEMRFCRRTSWMPPPPADTKHHPSSVNIELLKQIRMQSKCTVLKHFLQKDFTSVGPQYALRLISEMGSGQEFTPDMKIADISDKQASMALGFANL
ncbi:DNA topoisomerase 6 subunit B [Cymbomonas tetramitiformis]|uniref:DNA topoisomerase 6 subunit B n=1 Tax=Cymbomonas tetramitiformis TaxID=36881 RepID=A0AAE0FSJ5_9CHLO|nr:DNA topoisomerase 6 subunit B [Cymbomonas tetramitiformis]